MIDLIVYVNRHKAVSTKMNYSIYYPPILYKFCCAAEDNCFSLFLFVKLLFSVALLKLSVLALIHLIVHS